LEKAVLKPIFALTVAGLISADAQAQDSSLVPGPLKDKAPTKVDKAASASAVPGVPKTIQSRVNPANLVQQGLVPGPLRGGTVNTASVFYDNGNTDGTNGYSDATIGVFGARRTLLDDFSIGANTLAAISWTHVWASGFPPPFGTGAEFQFRANAGGTPGAVTSVATVTGYTEVATGAVFFSRPEALSCATVSPIAFGAGTHWLEGTVVGADNNFWLVKSTVTGAECWVNYQDFGGLFPGTSIFGVPADLNFKLDNSGCPCVPKGCAGSIYDNGPTDGSNGYSNATIGVFGARRTLLDDFNLGGYTNVDGLRWTHIWASGFAPPFGTNAEISFRADAGGSPGAVSDVAAVSGYSEVCTGNIFFSRPEAESTADFGAIQLAPGNHWLEGTVVGADNNFWMIRSSVTGSQCWVNYDDFGGLLPGSSIFGVSADLNFCLQGAAATCIGALYDNGETDGTNGYSDATVGVFGARRTLLDDFTIGGGTPSDITWTHIWASGFTPPFGTDAEMFFRNDAGGSPGATFTGDMVTGYTEAATGNTYFSRPEAVSTATLASPALGAGTYWVEGTVVGADNNFWLVKATVTGAQCWVNYDDFGGLFPGSSIFGVTADLNFCLGGGGGGPTTYCDPSDGHNNNVATISASGTSLGTTITIDLAGGPAGQFGYLLIGDGTGIVNPPLSKGHLCLLGGACLGRYAKDVGTISGAGTLSTDIEDPLSSATTYGIPTCGGTIDAGETWNFQYWHRQPMGQPSTFSQALSVTFTN
jgi:hypothetical protein